MKKVLAFLSLWTIVFVSCEKETSLESPGDPPPPPPIDSSVLLKKFIVLDTTQAAPGDTITIYTYTYDHLNRCTQIKVNDFQNNEIGYTYNYYNGNDSLIASRKLVNQVYSDSVIEYFKYNTFGQMVSDSVLEYNSSSLVVFKYKYQLTANLITSDITVNGQPFNIGKYIVTKDNGGNTIQEKDTCFLYNSGTYSYLSNTDVITTYDNQPCPFFKLYPQRMIEMDYELVAVDDVPFYLFLQKKNVKTKQWISMPVNGGIGNRNETFQYSYNSKNYPVTVIYKDLLLGEVYKGIYIY